MARRGKKLPASERWRRDQDYRGKLSKAEREWLDRFNDEYYSAQFKAEPLHAEGEDRREIYADRNAGARDIVTISDKQRTKASLPISNRPSLICRFYSVADYPMLMPPPSAAAIADLLSDAIDQASELPDEILPLRREA